MPEAAKSPWTVWPDIAVSGHETAVIGEELVLEESLDADSSGWNSLYYASGDDGSISRTVQGYKKIQITN